MEKKYLVIGFLFVCLNLSAQSRHTLYLNTGFTFNPSITLNGDEVENSLGIVVDFGGTYRLFNFKSFYNEIGIGGKTIFAFGEVDDDTYSSNTLRLTMPVKVTFPVNDTWELTGAFVFQNNLDLIDTDLRLRDKYSWRVDFLAETHYIINEFWYLTAGLRSNLRKMPDPFFINDPKYTLQMGIARRLYFKKKENP